MTDIDLLEMACDCHARSKQYGTNLLEYIDKLDAKTLTYEMKAVCDTLFL